jgi:hypothetical protein
MFPALINLRSMWVFFYLLIYLISNLIEMSWLLNVMIDLKQGAQFLEPTRPSMVTENDGDDDGGD